MGLLSNRIIRLHRGSGGREREEPLFIAFFILADQADRVLTHQP